MRNYTLLRDKNNTIQKPMMLITLKFRVSVVAQLIDPRVGVAPRQRDTVSIVY